MSSVARQFDLPRITVRKYLNQADPLKYQRAVPRPCPKLDGYQDQTIELATDAAQYS